MRRWVTLNSPKERLPDNPAVMDTLGWIYYLKGTYFNAVAEFQDSLARNPNDPTVNYHLGLALFKRDQKREAKASLEKALKLDGKFEGGR